MHCTECGSKNLKITDSRYYDSGLLDNTKRRKRVCRDCHYSFHTFELSYSQEEIEKIIKALNQKKWKAHWSDEEDRQLVEMYKSSYNISAIAANLERSHEAVRKRIYVLGLTTVK